MQHTFITRIIDCIAIIIIVATGLFLWNNKDFFPVPDSDIFQYINDTRQYVQFKIPQNIQLPPVFPILLGVITNTLHSFSYPEILAAHIINITAAVITLVFVYLLVRTYSPFVGLSVILLLVTSPSYLFLSLNVNTEVLFTTIITCILLLYANNHKRTAYLLAGCTFLLRYESILLLVSMIIVDVIKKTHLRKMFWIIIASLIPVFFWFIVLNTHSETQNILGNGYIQEVLQHHQNIPQFMLIERLPILLMDYVDTYIDGNLHTIIVALLYIFLTTGIVSAIKSRFELRKLIGIFVVLYIFFHSFFPYAPDRYIYPVLWGLYLMSAQALVAFLKKIGGRTIYTTYIALCIVIGIILYICIGNVQRSKEYYEHATTGVMFSRFDFYETRLAATWLNENVFDQPTVVVTFEPWILQYYTVNRMVSFLPLSQEGTYKCASIRCIIQTGIDSKINQVLFIQQSNTLSQDDTFPSATNFHISIFNKFPNDNDQGAFRLLANLHKSNTWVKIYQYQPKD